jgi:hypothetical protein
MDATLDNARPKEETYNNDAGIGTLVQIDSSGDADRDRWAARYGIVDQLRRECVRWLVHVGTPCILRSCSTLIVSIGHALPDESCDTIRRV